MKALIETTNSLLLTQVEGNKNGTNLILLHGFPLTQNMWDKQVEALGDEYRIIRYDIAGLGESKSKLHSLSIDHHVEDLVSLMNQLQIDQAVLLGFSMGGYITLRFAKYFSERLQALILANTRFEGDTAEARKKRMLQIESIQEGPLYEFAINTAEALLRQNQEDNESLKQSLVTEILNQPPSGLCSNLMAMALRPDSTDVLAAIKTPTLVITSSDDKVIPPGVGSVMAAMISNSTYVEIEGAGHLSSMEQPAGFNKILRSFLRSNVLVS